MKLVVTIDFAEHSALTPVQRATVARTMLNTVAAQLQSRDGLPEKWSLVLAPGENDSQVMCEVHAVADNEAPAA